MARRAKAKADLDRLKNSGETQLSTTDADARLLSKRGHVIAGYNVQIAVDAKHKLIATSEVVNDGNDTGQLYEVAEAAKEALGVETLQAVADTGYYNGATLKECEEGGIVAYVPPPKRTGGLEEQGRFTHEAFSYDAEADVYRCPAGALLKPMNGVKISPAGRQDVRYVSLKSVCKACHLREQCLGQKSDKRTIYRWQHEEVIDRHRERMKDAGALMRQRACLVEHPFGTLKCRAGYRHFLVRGFDKVRGEWSLMALCYNLARVINILGFDAFVAFFANRAAERAILCVLCTVMSAISRATASMKRFSAKLGQNSAILRFSFSTAAVTARILAQSGSETHHLPCVIDGFRFALPSYRRQ